MAIHQVEEEQVGTEELQKARLGFAERCLINAQDLSRMMDLKASFLLSAVALMTAALGIVASKALDARADPGAETVLKIAGLVSFVAYIILAFTVVYSVTRVFKALGRMLAPNSQSLAPGLIFPLIVLERYQADGAVDEEMYFSKLAQVSSRDMLRDYTNQVLEVSAIYRRKQLEINTSVRLFQYLSISWIITILLFLLLLATSIFR
jgi:hypothetical protein